MSKKFSLSNLLWVLIPFMSYAAPSVDLNDSLTGYVLKSETIPYLPDTTTLQFHTDINQPVLLCVDTENNTTGVSIDFINNNGETETQNVTKFNGFSRIEYNPAVPEFILEHPSMQCFSTAFSKKAATVILPAKNSDACIANDDCLFSDEFEGDNTQPPPVSRIDLATTLAACSGQSFSPPRDGNAFCYEITVENTSTDSDASNVYVREFFPIRGTQAGGYTVHTDSTVASPVCTPSGSAVCGSPEALNDASIPAGDSITYQFIRQIIAENDQDSLQFHAATFSDLSNTATAERETNFQNNAVSIAISQNQPPRINNVTPTSLALDEDASSGNTFSFELEDLDGDIPVDTACEASLPGNFGTDAFTLSAVQTGSGQSASCLTTVTLAADKNTDSSPVNLTLSYADTAGSTATAGVSVTVAPVNDLPSYTSGGNVGVTEDSTAYNAAWASNVSPGPYESEAVNFTVESNSNSDLFSVQPVIASDGTLQFTPAADAFGSADITITLTDGSLTTTPETFTISVNADNDVPSFTIGSNETVDEDSGTHLVTAWATNISAGAGESGQTISFDVVPDKPEFFSAEPAVNSSGDLSYTLADNRFGTASIDVRVNDGFVDSAPQNFTITVNPVNDAPEFTFNALNIRKGTINVGDNTVSDILASYSPGPFESETLNWLVSTIDTPSVISTASVASIPALDFVLTGTTGTEPLAITADDGQNSNNSTTQTLDVIVENCAALPAGTISWWPGQFNMPYRSEIIDSNNSAASLTNLQYNNFLSTNPVQLSGSGVSQGEGKIGQAYTFNGSDTMTLSMNDLDFSDDFTLAFWLNPSSSSGTLFEVGSTNADHLIVSLASSRLVIEKYSGNKNSKISTIGFSSSQVLPSNAWSHIVLSRTAGTLDIYIDNDGNGSVDETGLTPYNQSPSGDMTVGNGYNGRLDEIQFMTQAIGSNPEAVALQNFNIDDQDGISNTIGSCFSNLQTCMVSSPGSTSCPQSTPTPGTVSNEHNHHILVKKKHGWDWDQTFQLEITLKDNLAGDDLEYVNSSMTVNSASRAPVVNDSNNYQSLLITLDGNIDFTACSGNCAIISFNTSSGLPSFDISAMGIRSRLLGVADYDPSDNDDTFGLGIESNSAPMIDYLDGQDFVFYEDASNTQAFFIIKDSDDNLYDTGSNETQTDACNAAVLGDPAPSVFSLSVATATGHPGQVTCYLAVTLIPDQYTTGSESVSISFDDGNGGTATGNINITVDPANDAPSFTTGGNVSVLEDSSAYSSSWASALSAGPTDENGQILTFNISNSNPTLFASEPSLANDGSLSFTPATDEYGSATVTVSLSDDGGTANGGIDTSPEVTFNIQVYPVNDAPSFTSGGDVTVNEDSGAYSAAWASNLSPGPSNGNESFQVLTFSVSNDDNSLFSVQPAIEPGGTLSFTPQTGTTGSATVSVTLNDDGGTSSGGVNTTVTENFTLRINAIPVATDDNGSTTAGAPTDVDVCNNDDDTDLTDTLSITHIDGNAVNSSGDTAILSSTAIVTFNGDCSALSYNPNGITTADSFSYTITDGIGGTATATVNITNNQ